MKREEDGQRPFRRMAEWREAVREVDEEVVRLTQCGLPVARLFVTLPGHEGIAERVRLGGDIAHAYRAQIGFRNFREPLAAHLRLVVDNLDLMPARQSFRQDSDADF